MGTEKQFIGKVTEKTFDNGGAIIKLSLSPDDLKKVSKTGWLNINIQKSMKGAYYAVLDTWEPKPKVNQPESEDTGLPF